MLLQKTAVISMAYIKGAFPVTVPPRQHLRSGFGIGWSIVE
jgi:hypothetical protein